jgi:hypothetical protein
LLSVSQLLGDWVSVGVQYSVSQAELDVTFPEVPTALPPDVLNGFQPVVNLEAILNQVNVWTVLNHPSGFFARFDANWYDQHNSGNVDELPGDHFWQLNALIGYRFPQQRAEVSIGVLNFTDTNYQLYPLNLYRELPRERTFVARLRFSF